MRSRPPRSSLRARFPQRRRPDCIPARSVPGRGLGDEAGRPRRLPPRVRAPRRGLHPARRRVLPGPVAGRAAARAVGRLHQERRRGDDPALPDGPPRRRPGVRGPRRPRRGEGQRQPRNQLRRGQRRPHRDRRRPPAARARSPRPPRTPPLRSGRCSSSASSTPMPHSPSSRGSGTSPRAPRTTASERLVSLAADERHQPTGVHGAVRRRSQS